MTTPATRNLAIPGGDAYAHRVTITDGTNPTDVSGRTYRAHLRRLGSSSSSPAASFVIDTTDAATGVLVLALSSTVTAALSGTYRWSLEQTISGDPLTILEGYATVSRDVTRS